MKVITILSIILFYAGCVVGCKEEPKKQEQTNLITQQPETTQQTYINPKPEKEEGIVKQGFGAAYTQADYEKFMKFLLANDKVSVYELDQSGRVFKLEKGRKVKILARRDHLIMIKYVGESNIMWTMEEAIE